MGLEDFSMLGPSDVLALDHQQDQEQIGNRRGRKRKAINVPAEPETVVPATPVSVIDTPDISVVRDASGQASETIPSFGPVDNLPGDLSGMPPPETLRTHTPTAHLGSPDPNMLASPNAPPHMSPGGMSMGGRTPAELHHGGMTPMHYGGGSTPMHLPEGGMTPGYSGDFSAVDMHNPAYTPAFSAHGGITPHHGIMENLESIPNLPADQVSSILNGTGLENIGFSNMGYDEPPNATPRAGGISERVQNDWNDDYECPPSVGPHVSIPIANTTDIIIANLSASELQQPGDEQMENETDEQFEERVLNKRAAQMFVSVRARMLKTDHLYLSEMTTKNSRKQVLPKSPRPLIPSISKSSFFSVM